ncbi:potassium/proton antiporter [Guyparkeria hydrothermalis]|uniref:potassium/proton antiporter n=1 Tax=Guyparkeria hydrothermalis TaxID=923 RepID=UPI002020B826|nr:potassium/proton antiporter [Guyparkeria hydrothermalis]MCL7750344.1 potassium/proton antiporter [Guyparkeria hydrothermalis]
MDATNSFILLGALLLFTSILAGMASSRFGFPLLLIFLGVGMLAGQDGIGGVQFDDFETAFLIGNLALAIILLDGGLRTHIRTFRVALKPALSLATVGVMITAGAMGALATWLMGFDWYYGLLMGAIIGSTDAAAVFSLLKGSGTRLNERVGSTLEIESGINDPMAIFLTITLLEVISAGQSLFDPWILVFLVQQFGIGAVLGVAFGFVLREVLRRIELAEGLYALLIASGGLLSFALINELGGSGFLGVYLTGLVIGTARNRGTFHVLRIMDGLAWLAQAGMFLILGLLVTPTAVLDQIVPALILAFALLLVARPIAIWIGLWPFHFNWRETTFIAWVGLRGAVPIVLALFPMIYGIPDAERFFEIAYVVVITSLLIQGSTVPLAARLLKVEVPPLAEPRQRADLNLPIEPRLEMVQFVVGEHTDADGAGLDRLPFGESVTVAGVVRNLALRKAERGFRFQAGDIVLTIIPEDMINDLNRFFTGERRKKAALAEQTFFGAFSLRGGARIADLAQVYGIQPPEALQEATLDEAIKSLLRNPPVVGDSVDLDRVSLTVREMEGPTITQVGLKFREEG